MPLKVRWPHWPLGESPVAWRAASKLTMAAVGVTSKIFMEWFNTKTEYNAQKLHEVVDHRAPGQGLVTFSNHHSCLDEPLLWSVLAWRHLTWAVEKMRWTTGAADVCFNKEWHSRFFALGRTIPLVRGDGVQQESINFALDLVNAGRWVHIYPEGKVTREEVRLKWGVGRIIAEAEKAPIVVGFYHVGMDDLLPNQRPYRLHRGKKVTMVVGEPLDLSHVLQEAGRGVDAVVQRRRMVTECLQTELSRLRSVAWNLHTAPSSGADLVEKKMHEVTVEGRKEFGSKFHLQKELSGDFGRKDERRKVEGKKQ